MSKASKTSDLSKDSTPCSRTSEFSQNTQISKPKKSQDDSSIKFIQRCPSIQIKEEILKPILTNSTSTINSRTSKRVKIENSDAPKYLHYEPNQCEYQQRCSHSPDPESSNYNNSTTVGK